MKRLTRSKIGKYYGYYVKFGGFISHFLLLILRLKIGEIYFKSGLTKISVWDQTLILFEYEYEVPLLPVELAAIMSTAAELICPILLVLGVLSRISVLPLLVMTVIIEFFIIQNIEHLYWMLMMGTIMAFGSGKISIDGYLAKIFKMKI